MDVKLLTRGSSVAVVMLASGLSPRLSAAGDRDIHEMTHTVKFWRV
jgi:hypothetical protein